MAHDATARLRASFPLAAVSCMSPEALGSAIDAQRTAARYALPLVAPVGGNLLSGVTSGGSMPRD